MTSTIAKTVHKIGGWVLLIRLLFFDALWLLPRQPVTYYFAFGVPRVIQLALAEWYHFFGHWFDGDITPQLWLVVLVALLASGGFSLSILWSKASRSRKLLSVVIFLLSPLAWSIRHFHIIETSREIKQRVDRAFSVETAGSELHVESPYDLVAHLANKRGGLSVLSPNRTIVYKTAKMAYSSACTGDLPFGLPADSFFSHHREEMEKGVLKLDVYEPPREDENDKLRPVLLYIHGGGWKRGDRAFLRVNYHGGLPHFMLERGFVIVSMTYRLSCSGVAEPGEMIEDVRDAVKFIETNAQQWGANGRQVVMWGTSAGGNLALNCAFKYRPPSVVGVISHYGVIELREEQLLSQADTWWKQVVSSAFVLATRHLCERSKSADCFSDISPLHHLTSSVDSDGIPPILMIHGYEDPLVFIDQAFWLEKELSARHIPHALIPVHGSHDCDCHVSSPCAQATLYSVERFLHYLGLS